MKSSTASLAFGALLLASLAGKLAASGTSPEPDNALFAARAAALLRAEGMATQSEQRPLGMLVYGRRAGCTIMVGEYTPYGTFADVFARRAAPVGPLRFVYRGRRYAKAPKLAPLISFYLRRELLRIGLATPRMPIAAIAVSPGCGPTEPDWAALATLPA